MVYSKMALSYYLDSQIKDDFTCDQNCYIKTQHKQQDQTITPCTHASDHITQYINNLEDPTQQHTVYTHEVDASLFTTDTTTSCEYNITTDLTNSDNTQESKANIIQPMGTSLAQLSAWQDYASRQLFIQQIPIPLTARNNVRILPGYTGTVSLVLKLSKTLLSHATWLLEKVSHMLNHLTLETSQD